MTTPPDRKVVDRHKTNSTRQAWRVVCLLVFSFLTFSSCRDSATTTELHVAAASDLTAAFEEIGHEFEREHSIKVSVSFGASGMLAKQIENGAPMDVFAAANVAFVEQLERQNLIVADTKSTYARGRIILWTPKDSQLQISSISDLTKPEVQRIAIANPEYAPYGMAARDALQTAGIWESVKSKLVFGENIRQTFQFAQTGNVDVAVVSLSLSREREGKWVLIDSKLHKPLDQGMAVIKSTRNEKAARDFVAYVLSEKGRSILRKYGFEFPQ